MEYILGALHYITFFLREGGKGREREGERKLHYIINKRNYQKKYFNMMFTFKGGLLMDNRATQEHKDLYWDNYT